MRRIIISLNKQVHIYSVDTSSFYNEEELKIHKKLNNTYRFRKELKKIKNKKKPVIEDIYKEKIDRHISKTNKRIKTLKEKIYLEFTKNNKIRSLNERSINNRNIVSVFDSVLTRTLQIPINSVNTDIIIVQTYFFEIIEDIILNGFIYNNEKYVCFTASAGQIRTKKTVFIKESVYMENHNSLTCGLSIEAINYKGGVNINKYLAYLALCNSATNEWKDFNIDKTIVVEDMETSVNSLVDFIDENTYEITRKKMDMMINHTDGCGMILPKRSKKSMMIRMPWIKGLLVPFNFYKFIEEERKKPENKNKKIGIVKDIYGKEYNLIKDGIEIILTKSQFKMWKYYSSWGEYKDNFKKYNCQTGTCNEEEDIFKDAKLNYQMLQTLSDITNDELKQLSQSTRSSIYNIGRDKNTMLRVLGVTKANKNKNYYQQALQLYPELLSDTYSKEILKQVKKSMVREARAGKFSVKGKYTFICPDMYAFAEFLILRVENPNGLLQNGEVYCNLYKEDDKLNCLRSPHLYREHGVRKNVIDEDKSNWFITSGLYTSVHDPLSKLLMYDVDGDKSLVVSDSKIIEIAERNMNDIIPLHYNMAKADARLVDNIAIYEGLKAAYSGGNIGMISNDITKVWNSENVNLDVIKWLCMENNFVIDYAKTLYKVKRPPEIKKIITKYTKSKVPHFFIYAKGKKKENVEKNSGSIVDQLEKLIPNTRMDFKAANIGNFDHKVLMNNDNTELDMDVIGKYIELDKKSHFLLSGDEKFNNARVVYEEIKDKVLLANSNLIYVVDVLIKYLYETKKANFKTTLWESFGDFIVENIRNNVNKKSIQCESCGTRIEANGNRKTYCEECWIKNRRKYKTEKQKMYRIKNTVDT